MADSIWKSTLAGFRDQLATAAPTPAGVSTAAVSASLGLALLMKVLEITRNRKNFSGDPRRIEEMLVSARQASLQLDQCADDDIAAFNAYMSTRLPAALHRAIEVPLRAGHAAVTGIDLCREASAWTPKSIAPDLGAAASLLAASARAILLSVDSNAQHLTDPRFQQEVMTEHQALLRRIG